MSNEIPLNVVYQRVEDAERSIHLDDSSSSYIIKEASQSDISTESSCNKPCRRRACCIKFFACIGITATVCSLFWMMLTLVITFRAYSSFNNCFHGESYILQESVNSNVSKIQFDVITGLVHIDFHEGSDVIVRLYDRFRSFDAIDRRTIQSNISVLNGVVNIKSESPAFNFHTCQHASVEILIPSSLSNPIAISGIVNTGYVKIHGADGASLSTVELVVQAGKVDLKEIVAKDIYVSSSVGCLNVKHSIASNSIKLLVQTGSIRTHDIITKDLQAVTQYGRSLHDGVVADKVHVETKWGYNYVVETSPLSNEQKIDVITEYGSNLLYVSSPKVDFKLNTKKGYMVVDYENESWECKVHNATVSILNGKCSTLEKSDSNSHSEITIKSTYGTSNLIIDEEDE
jgi:hypothetical protein